MGEIDHLRVRGLAECARGAWYEAHETLETAWRAATDDGERRALQGLVQLAAALHLLESGSPAGAGKVFRRARAKLAPGVPAPWGLDGGRLARCIDDWLERLEAGAPTTDVLRAARSIWG